MSHNTSGIPNGRTRPVRPARCRFVSLIGALASAIVASPVLAGGADVSTDEVYTDGVTLTNYDGSPLDIDGDGDVDLAIAVFRNATENPSRYYLGNGDGTFSPATMLTAGPSSDIEAVPLNADAFIDLVQLRRDLTDLFYLGDGAGGLNAAAPIAAAEEWRTLSVATGDLDQDGDLDFVTGNGRPGATGDPAQANRFYLNDLVPGGAVAFAGGDISAVDLDTSRSIALADLDGDTDLDVVVGNDYTTANGNRVYLNLFVESGMAAVSFAPGIDFGPAADLTTEVLVGDLNGDGRPDIVSVNAADDSGSSGVNRFFLNTTVAGVFSLDAGIAISPDTDRTNAGVLADFDGDGDLDLAVANFLAQAAGQSSRNRLYLNRFVPDGTVSFDASDISPDEHMTHSIGAGDIDGDGDVDLIAGNEDDVAGVRDRRYLNNGTADPFTNVVPSIDSQANVLTTVEETDLTITLTDVSAVDGDNVFPVDFTLMVQSGTDYTVVDNTITPDADFVGDLTVPVIVNDGTDDSEPFDLTVTVTGVNDAPVFTSTAVTAASQDRAYSYSITASDPDAGDALEFTAPTLPSWLTLTDNGDGTATLTGTPGSAHIGGNAVSLRVSDGAASADQDFTVTVSAAPTSGGGGGGGSTGLLALLVLLGAAACRRCGARPDPAS